MDEEFKLRNDAVRYHRKWHSHTRRSRIIDGKKQCSVCKAWKPTGEFNKSVSSSTGLSCKCAACSIQQVQSRRSADTKAYLQALSRTHKYNLAHGSRRRQEWLADSCVCTEVLCELWNSQGGLCAVTKVPMTHLEGQGQLDTNVTIDRIDNDVGYTRDNIRLVCRAVNLMRSNMTMEELKKWCLLVLNSQ